MRESIWKALIYPPIVIFSRQSIDTIRSTDITGICLNWIIRGLQLIDFGNMTLWKMLRQSNISFLLIQVQYTILGTVCNTVSKRWNLNMTFFCRCLHLTTVTRALLTASSVRMQRATTSTSVLPLTKKPLFPFSVYMLMQENNVYFARHCSKRHLCLIVIHTWQYHRAGRMVYCTHVNKLNINSHTQPRPSVSRHDRRFRGRNAAKVTPEKV